MEQLAIYLLKSALCTAAFLGIYWCFFKNETFYKFNRHFLITGLICSIVLPFYTYTYDVNIIASESFFPVKNTVALEKSRSNLWIYAIILTYVAGACILLLRHIFGLRKIRNMISRYGYTTLQGYKLVTTPVFKSSFSVFNYIIIDSSSATSDTERKLILEHELAHVKQFHWADLLISQVFCAFQWFNPFAWIYLHAIKQNHEFLADQAVLAKGNSAAVYRAALINHSLGTPVFTFASSFSQYDKLKRINMMMKPASGSLKKVAVFILLPALACFIWAFAKPNIVLITPSVKKEGSTALLPVAIDQTKMTIDETQVTAGGAKTDQDSSVKMNTAKALKKQSVNPVNVKEPVAISDTVMARAQRNPIKAILNVSANRQPLYYLDGIEISSLNFIKSEDIEAVDILKEQKAIETYGERARNGVIQITLKKARLIGNKLVVPVPIKQ